ncbi:MAG TPA: hypothetical protein VG848_06185 [Acetobacteraceae bacterium]|nr:hypothetical protein [Acetobacteraceae bacterium]
MLAMCTQGFACSKAAIAAFTSLAVAASADAQFANVIRTDLPLQLAACAGHAMTAKTPNRAATSPASFVGANIEFPPFSWT